jgi:hypothetical protein
MDDKGAAHAVLDATAERPMLRGMHEKPLKEQLIEARAKILREIDILRTPSLIGLGSRPDKAATIEMLKARLQEIDEALAGLGDDDA